MSFLDKFHKVKVHMPFDPIGTKVWLDDVEIRGLVCISMEARAGEMPVVVLELYPQDNEIEITSEGPLTMQVVKAE